MSDPQLFDGAFIKEREVPPSVLIQHFDEALRAHKGDLARANETLADTIERMASLQADFLELKTWTRSLEAELARTLHVMAAILDYTMDSDRVEVSEVLAARQAELARMSEVLTARVEQMRSLETDLLARNERLGARQAELAGTSEALIKCNLWAKSLETRLHAKQEALAVARASKSWKIMAPLRSVRRAGLWLLARN
jgi:uncharacterized coiled-coil protein SlyX